MFRTAAKRLFSAATHYSNGNVSLRFPPPQSQIFVASCRFSTSESQPFPNPHSTDYRIPTTTTTTEPPTFSDSPSSSSSSTSSSSDEEGRRHDTPRTGGDKYQDEQARVLQASLPYVVRTLSLPLFFFPQFFYLFIIHCSNIAIQMLYKFFDFLIYRLLLVL